MLPDYDIIHSLNCTDGMYREDRWPLKVVDLQKFLQEIIDKWGPEAEVCLVPEYDGYPGYVFVGDREPQS